MATNKPPRIPHPPLEMGVAQYPTPLIPDYYTKYGHIILVEKVDIDKGSFNPQQPAVTSGGAVTYTGKDANKWPSPLYLVHEKPTEDGEYVYRIWANDRSLADQDPWNYGITYTGGDPTLPSYTREYIIAREQYSAAAVGTQDPIFSTPGAPILISEQSMEPLPDGDPLRSRYVRVKRFYEAIPGTVLTTNTNGPGLMGITATSDQLVTASTFPNALSFDVNDGSVLESSVEHISANKSNLKTITTTGPYSLQGTASSSGLLGDTQTVESIVGAGSLADEIQYDPSFANFVIDSKVTPIDATKSKKTTTLVEATSATTLSGLKNDSGLLGVTQSTETIVAYGASPDALSFVGGGSNNVISSEVTPIDKTKSKKTTVVSQNPVELDGKTIGEYGYVNTSEVIVPYSNSLTTPDVGTIKLEQTPIDTTKAKLTKAEYQSTQVLTGYKYDEYLNEFITVQRQIVPAGQNTTIAPQGNGLLTYSDEMVDVWKTVNVQTSLSQLPPPRVEYKQGSYSTPLLVLGITSGFPSSAILADISVNNGIVGPSNTASYYTRLQFDTIASQSFQCTYQTTTSFSFGSPTFNPTDPSNSPFSPVLTTFQYTGYKISFNLGPCLCNNISGSVTVGYDAIAGGEFVESFSVPATSPAASDYPWGQYVTVSYNSEYYKSNIWVTTVVKALLPALPA